MFSIVGSLVIYGFCLYGMLRMVEDLQAADTDESAFVKP
jgi:hypothetical protein